MKYIIDYLDKEGDLTHVWLNADSESEAECEARREYWDIDRIIDIRRAK